MDTGWIAAVGTLPQDLRDVMTDEQPPASYGDLGSSEAWAMIFNAWAQFAHTLDPTPLGNINAFLLWAQGNWNADPEGNVWTRPEVSDVRQVYESFFAGITTANPQLQAAMAEVAGSQDADEDDGSQLAHTLSTAAVAACDAKYALFCTDIARFGARAAKAGSYADDTTARVRAENQRVVAAIPDRQYTDLAVYNWGGTVLVMLGDGHSTTGLPPVSHDGYIAKRRARIGAGEWVVSDPGEWLQWITYEMSQLGSKKDVVVGDPQKYDAWNG